MSATVRQAAAALQDYLIALRRDLHQHPELSFQERRTAAIIRRELEAAGVTLQPGILETGVVGLLPGARPGPTILVRADTDALPLQEVGDKPYRSQNPGVMHACGHDGHVAITLGVARLLAAQREQLAGQVKFVFQPAEEVAGGARPMIEGGVMDNPPVDQVIGLHIWNSLPAGLVGVRDGPLWASVDRFTLVIEGQGGHGALPHQAVDPVVIAAQVITALQTLVSREVAPTDTAVVTVGKISGGSAWNIIAPEVVLEGTLRAFSPETRTLLQRRVEEVAAGVCAAMRGAYRYTLSDMTPPVVNDPAVAERVRAAAEKVLGPERVIVSPQSMAGDDMAEFLNRAPGCYFILGGGARSGKPYPPHHHPAFDFDESILPDGVAVMAQVILDALQP
jgi:amidohydrolase